MEQDIRALFKKNDELKKLPENHKDEFLGKLKNSKQNTSSKPKYSFVYRIAAVLIIGLSIGYGVFKTNFNTDKVVEENILVQQIESIEKEYLANIEQEWQSFLMLTKDEKLVKRFENKLADLDAYYKDISIEFQEDTNDIIVLEALVENLQTRLNILKDIQKHIKILNQKNEQNENTI